MGFSITSIHTCTQDHSLVIYLGEATDVVDINPFPLIINMTCVETISVDWAAT